MRIVARAPNHLGDAVMALPAMHALSRLGGLIIQGPPILETLYREVPAGKKLGGWAGRPDVAVLFPPSLRAAVQALGARRRIGVAADGRGLLLTDIVAQGGHRTELYRRLAEAAGAEVQGPPKWNVQPWDPEADVPAQHIALNPISKSGATVEWRGFRALADRLAQHHPVVFYGGPGEEAAVSTVAGPHPTRVGLPLDAFGSALLRCRLFISNDSGAAHFARAVGRPMLVIYGSTRPERTGPIGSTPIVGPQPACWPCYRKRCDAAFECLDISVDQVCQRVQEVLGG